MRSSHFFEFIEKGLLPNFKKLMENGISSKTCITDFPSVTYPTQPTILTGTYTGDFRNEPCHGIPSYHWMDRGLAPPTMRDYGWIGSDEYLQIYKMNSDLGDSCQTLLEMLGDGNHSSITQLISRGANYLYPENKIKLAFLYELLVLALYKTKYEKSLITRANTIVVRKLLDTFKNPRKYFDSNEAPIGSNLWFMSSDALMHIFGYNSYIYKLNLMHIDKVMGDLLADLDKMGYLHDTAIVITADHGNYLGKNFGDISHFFKKTGLTNYHKRKNLKGMVNISEFGSVGHFHFKGKNHSSNKHAWPRPSLRELESFGSKRVNLLDEVLNLKGTRLLYYREDGNTHKKGTIHLKRKNPITGQIFTSMIEYKGTGENYRTKYISEDEENDVFKFLSDEYASKMLDGKFHTIEEWTNATHHLDHAIYPDIIPRHFKNPRSADLIISTGGEYAYNIAHGKRRGKSLYSHDIGTRASTIVPLIIGGSPEIQKKGISYCKTTDIVPTIVKMLGKTSHKSVVGKSLI